MKECSEIDLDAQDDVLNRALLFRDRRDFAIRTGDNGKRGGQTAMTANECEIEPVDVRTLWKHEALDFTPWLAENLHLLGDALGMKLELVRMEHLVGPYRLDILAKEVNKGVMVAIENQLEETNLEHLGQLLTYAAGCDARIAIWVAPEFGYELAQALHWLNEWSSKKIRFYGVKVEVVKKAGSETSKPRFRKVVGPCGWDEEITRPSGEMPLETRRYHEFFQPLITKLLAEDFADKALTYFGPTGRCFRSRVDPNIWYALSFDGANNVSASLLIETDNRTLNKCLFERLKEDQEEIERRIAAHPESEWKWRVYQRSGSYAVSIRMDGSINDPPERLEWINDWMFDLLQKFKAVFDPRLEEALEECANGHDVPAGAGALRSNSPWSLRSSHRASGTG